MNNDEVFDPDQIILGDANIIKRKSDRILENSDEGIKFIAKILEKKKERHYRRHQFRDYIRSDILACFSKVNLPGELKFKRQLEQLARKIDEISSIEDLKNKTFVGVGGGFSAGKSRFINSLLDCDVEKEVVSLLPEDQGPTTSIPTFIVSNTEDEIYAVTSNCPKIQLTFDEVQALAHQFYETYHFGFNQFIRRLVVKTTKFPYKNIVLLDTPGYTKDNVGTIKEARDVEKAKEQLKMVDYLIWVIDPDEGGGLTDSDVKFISELGKDKPITFVVNKCDKVPEDKVNEIIDYVKQIALDSNFRINKIFKYSSLERKGFERDDLELFLKEIDKINPEHNLKTEIEKITNEIQAVAQEEYRKIEIELSSLNTKIDESLNPYTIRALVAGQKILIRKKILFEQALKKFKEKKNQIDKVYDNCKLELDNNKRTNISNAVENYENKPNSENSIELLSKILEEKSVSVDLKLEKKYSDLYSFIFDDIANIIDNLTVANKTNIIERLKSCLESIYLLVLEPKLIGKTVVAFTVENVNDYGILKRLLTGNNGERLRINNNVITFFLYGESKEVCVCNRTDNKRALSKKEYALSNFLWQQHVSINDIVKFYSISSNTDYENLVCIYVPKYAYNDDIFQKLPLVVDHIVANRSDNICEALCKKKNIQCVWLKNENDKEKKGIKESDLTSFLKELNSRKINYLFSHEIRNICNDVLLELSQLKDDLQKLIEDAKLDALIAEDDIMHNYIGNVCTEVKNYIQQQDDTIKNVKEYFNKLILMSKELEDLCFAKVNTGENVVQVDSSVAIGIVETCVGYKKLGMTKEYELMKNYLEKLYPDKVFLLQLWNKKGYSSEIIYSGIQKLKNEDIKSPLIRKLLIKYVDKVGIDVEKLVNYIEHSVSYETYSFEECVLCGDYYLKKNIKKAFEYYFRAAELSPDKIGILCDKMLSVPEISKRKRYLEDIAKLYDAKGLFFLAEACGWKKDSVKKTRLYKIAATLGNDEAVVRLLGSYSFKYRDSKEKYKNVASTLAYHLLQKGIAVDIANEVLGRIAYDDGDYLEAEQKWRECNTKYATYSLGRLYQFGKRDSNNEWVFPANLVEAKNCFEQAVELGHPKARENLQKVNEWIEKNNIKQETRNNRRIERSDYSRKVYYSGSSDDGFCVPGETMVTMENGDMRQIEQIRVGDSILAFNHFSGRVEATNVFAVINHNSKHAIFEVVTLIFSDGTRTSLVKAHCYFDVTLNKYIEINVHNCEEFVKHKFLKLNNIKIEEVVLVDIGRENRDVTIYEIITSHCLNFITDGVLSASMYLDKWLNIFDFYNEGYKYNLQQVEEMVNQYGLSKAEDFPMLPSKCFEIGNGKYFKAAIALNKINYNDVYEISDIARKFLKIQELL